MRTHPLWRSFEVPSDAEVARGRVTPHVPAVVEVVAPEPNWPADFARVRDRIADALGVIAVDIEHVGSTAVPGLWAKPVIDVDLVVPDSSDEPAYVPELDAAGFELRGRQPEWEEHRFFRGADPASNVQRVLPRRTRVAAAAPVP